MPYTNAGVQWLEVKTEGRSRSLRQFHLIPLPVQKIVAVHGDSFDTAVLLTESLTLLKTWAHSLKNIHRKESAVDILIFRCKKEAKFP